MSLSFCGKTHQSYWTGLCIQLSTHILLFFCAVYGSTTLKVWQAYKMLLKKDRTRLFYHIKTQKFFNTKYFFNCKNMLFPISPTIVLHHEEVFFLYKRGKRVSFLLFMRLLVICVFDTAWEVLSNMQSCLKS